MGAVQAHGAVPFYVAEKKRPTDRPRMGVVLVSSVETSFFPY